MNWGKGLTIAMIAFMGFIITLVVILMRQDVDLVNEDYYRNEIEYQSEINALVSGKARAPFRVTQHGDQLTFAFDSAQTVDSIRIYLWRPDNEQLDRQFIVTDNKLFLIPVSQLTQGQYDVRCEYFVPGATYVQQDQIEVKPV